MNNKNNCQNLQNINTNTNNKSKSKEYLKDYIYHLVCLSKEEDNLLVYDMVKFSTPIKIINFENKQKVNDFDFDYKNNLLICSSSLSGLITFYNAENYSLINSIDLNTTNMSFNTCININNLSGIMVTGGNDACINIWDTKEMISKDIIKKTDYCIKKAQISHDSKFLAVSYEEKTMPKVSVLNSTGKTNKPVKVLRLQ